LEGRKAELGWEVGEERRKRGGGIGRADRMERERTEEGRRDGKGVEKKDMREEIFSTNERKKQGRKGEEKTNRRDPLATSTPKPAHLSPSRRGYRCRQSLPVRKGP